MKKEKVFLFLLIAAFATLTGLSQANKTTGKVKSLVITAEKSDQLIKKAFKESETYYDQAGNITEEITYKEGKIKKHFKYQYDSDNNKIKEEQLDASGRIIESSEYKFENGLRVEKIVYDAGKRIKSKKVYTYTMF